MFKHRDRALKLFSSPHIISLIIFAFLRSSSCLTNPLSLTPSTHYGHSGSQQFPTNQYYNTTNTTISPLIYSITFPKPMADGAYKSGIAIQQINAQYHNSLFNITFYLYSKNRANLQFNIWSNTMHKIRTLTLRYMLFASNWLSSLTFYWFSQSGGPVSNTQTYSFTRSGLYSVNMTGTVKLFSCLTGFALSTTNPTNELSLIFSIERSSSTEIKGNLTSRSSQIMTVSQFSFNMIAYNEGQITAIPGRITLGTISANKGGTPLYTDINQIVRPYNTIFGLRGFYFKNEAFLSWKGTLTTNTSIQITSDNSFQYLQFIYMIIEVNWCIQATPYLMVATSICYDICPPRYYGNDDSWTCQTCVYDCYECLNPNNCTTCNITTDFREMNTTIMRCDPIDYYYDDGMNHATALPCDPNCLTCVTSNITCTSCAVGQFLAGSVCTKCMDHCANCSNSIDCIECENYFTFKQNLCSLNCTLMHSKCTTCQIKSNGQPQCLSCMAGYKLEKASCVFKSSSSEPNSTNLLLILLPLLLGLLLCCLLILFCVWRRRKNEQNKVKEQNEGEIQNTDPNDGQIDENLNESKDVFDEKVVLRKKKYRGDNTKINLKSKKRRMPVVQDTEVNELSVQQFKEALKSKNQENGNQKLHTAANEASQSHALTLNSQNHQKMIEEAKNKQMPQKNIKQEKENSERASSRDDDSESNATKNNEDGDQADGRGI